MNHNPYQAAANDLETIRSVAETYGFCLVKGVLAPTELTQLLVGMRDATRMHAGTVMPDLLSLPQIRDIYFHPKLLGIARALVGPALVYDGEGALNFEEEMGALTANPYNELHCDARGMADDLSAFWRSDTDALFQAYRFGIYFQDYRRASGSLKVIVGSHRGDPADYKGQNLSAAEDASIRVGAQTLKYRPTRVPLYNLPSEPGDVVLWNLRTFHSAGAKLFADKPDLAIHPKVEMDIAAMASTLFAPPPGPRNALFFDYAAPVEEVDLYIKQRARPTEKMFTGLLARHYDDPALIAQARTQGVELRLDSIIVAQSVWAHLAQQNAATNPERVRTARARIFDAFQQHREFSPYHPLLAPEQFRDAAAKGREALIDAVIAAVASATVAG